MLELAHHHGQGPVMMQSIATNQGVSRKYLDTIFSSLKNAGLIHSRRGIGGGHVLARPPDQIRVGDVMRAIEGPISLVDCVRDAAYCARSHRCATRDVWTEVTEAIEHVLDGITLADLLKRHHGVESGSSEAGVGDERCLVETPAP